MKRSLQVMMLLVSMQIAMAQLSKDPRPSPKYGTSWAKDETYRGKPAASINLTGDTLVIGEPTSLKVIQIGNEFYQIIPHATTIEKAPTTSTLGTSIIGASPYNIGPNGNLKLLIN
jgi:hypothetical protein